MKILCVAEKNSIAKALANALGGTPTTRSSPYKYVMNYDIPSYRFPQWGDCAVTVTAVAGHCIEYDFPPPYDKWGSIEPYKLFDLAVSEKLPRSQQNQQIRRNLEQECRSANKIYIWTDCDREGESIGEEITQICLAANRRLRPSDVSRAIFNNVDPQHLRDAAYNSISNSLDYNVANAVEVRRTLDLRIGAAFTRLQTMALQNLPYFKSRNSDKNKSSIISFGTCQMPTLRFVVDRYLSIKRFVPEPFWYLDLEVKPPSASAKRKNVKVSWARGRVYDRMAATVILQNCIKAKEQAKVISSTQKETRNFRPFPLTTVVLQQSGAKYLKIPSKRIMQLAEKLYNSGYISYPRTETDKFDKDIDIRKLVRVQFNANEWGNYARELIDSDKFRNPREGKHDDKAHPPIHPVKYLDRKDVTSEEYSVYEFISRHFLACCSEDALGQKTSVTMKWVTELFHCSGLVVTARNYLDVYKYQTWKSSEEIPDFPLHSLVTVKKANIGEGKTSAPPRLTEAELIRLMDVNGIGTDATMAEHIQTIIDRGYVLRTNGIMNPTSLGVALIESYTGIEKDNLTKPFMRRELEEQTTRVCKGELSKEECMKNASKSYQDVFVAVKGAESRFVNHIRLSLQESVS